MSAFYFNTLKNHQNTPTEQIVGKISVAYSGQHLDQKQQQTKAWFASIEIVKQLYFSLQQNIPNIENWGVLYEYKIPRRAKRIDIVLLSESIIFVIEIKNHNDKYASSDIAQLEDYCLDLRDFHYESKNKVIIPILLSTEANEYQNIFSQSEDFVQTTVLANKNNIPQIIQKLHNLFVDNGNFIDLDKWNTSKYSPTPTIIEAAQTLYSGQSVAEISRNHAGVENLSNTTNAVLEAIRNAQKGKEKVICFITGVPGAGKTLAGLNIVHNEEYKTGDKDLGVFLSGNSPLVKVLSEALARNFSNREGVNKQEARRRVKTFIHNVHEFIDEYYADKAKLPVDKVLIYDEAQRAWTKEHKARKSNGEITASEPEILMSIMNRIPEWGIIIALVGGGQEINTGEAGLREWGKAIKEKFSHWKVYISPELKQGDHSTGNLTLFESQPENIDIVEDSNLHLKVSIRSYKAQELSKWVGYVLDNNPQQANSIFKNSLKDFPLLVTRSTETLKSWLKNKSRGTRRTGIIASSGGRRLKALGFDPYYGLRGDSSQDELGAWYLNPTNDVRSSNFLEIIATEYAIQGLEIDWSGLLWDSDLRRVDGVWEFKQFKGTKWQSVNDEQKKQFILNKYRVLMTRAREGMVIFVPTGDSSDETRLPEFYDETYSYLKRCGLNEI